MLKARLKNTNTINATENILRSLWRAIRRFDELSRDETYQQAVPFPTGLRNLHGWVLALELEAASA